jgi:hypothetical protein
MTGHARLDGRADALINLFCRNQLMQKKGKNVMRLLPVALLWALTMTTQAAPVSQPYTFDYFVHAESGPKPTLVFGTGQTTYIQVQDGVVIQKILVRRGNSVKNAEIFYSPPYVVVKEFHDSLEVTTNKGVFKAERNGPKTEVELAADRADAALKKRLDAEAKARQQANTSAIKSNGTANQPSSLSSPDGVNASTPASTSGSAPSTASAFTVTAPLSAPDESITISIRNGEGVRSLLSRESAKLNLKLAWSLKEDRIASRNMTFVGARDEVLNDILVTFQLPGYLVEGTRTLHIIAKDQ